MPKLTALHTPAAENEVKLVEPQSSPVPVVIISDGLIQDIVGLDKYYTLDHDCMEYNMDCPYCLEEIGTDPNIEWNPNPTGKAGHFTSDMSKPWPCPSCGTDLNQARDNEEDAEIVRRVRG